MPRNIKNEKIPIRENKRGLADAIGTGVARVLGGWRHRDWGRMDLTRRTFCRRVAARPAGDGDGAGGVGIVFSSPSKPGWRRRGSRPEKARGGENSRRRRWPAIRQLPTASVGHPHLR